MIERSDTTNPQSKIRNPKLSLNPDYTKKNWMKVKFKL